MSRNPQILYNSILPEGEAHLDTNRAASVPGYPGQNIVTPFTYELARYVLVDDVLYGRIRWSSSSSSAHAVNAAGMLLFGDYFDSSGEYTGRSAKMLGTVELSGSDDGIYWSPIHIYEGLHSGSNYFSFDEVSFQHYEFVITITDPVPDPSGGPPWPGIMVSIANVMLGQRLEFERPIIRTHDPLPLNRTTEYQTNLSGSGQFLGRSISRRGVSTSVDIPMMSREFARGPFQDFVEHAQRYPYYFSWNEALYPGDAGYVWTDEDIQTGYSGDGSLMSASWSMRGF